jgi:hypothetical protein
MVLASLADFSNAGKAFSSSVKRCCVSLKDYQLERARDQQVRKLLLSLFSFSFFSSY